MSDAPTPTLTSAVWVVQDPPASPAARLGPFPDEDNAVSAGVAQMQNDSTWTAFTLITVWNFQTAS
jgi:hypothetical protein